MSANSVTHLQDAMLIANSRRQAAENAVNAAIVSAPNSPFNLYKSALEDNETILKVLDIRQAQHREAELIQEATQKALEAAFTAEEEALENQIKQIEDSAKALQAIAEVIDQLIFDYLAPCSKPQNLPNTRPRCGCGICTKKKNAVSCCRQHDGQPIQFHSSQLSTQIGEDFGFWLLHHRNMPDKIKNSSLGTLASYCRSRYSCIREMSSTLNPSTSEVQKILLREISEVHQATSTLPSELPNDALQKRMVSLNFTNSQTLQLSKIIFYFYARESACIGAHANIALDHLTAQGGIDNEPGKKFHRVLVLLLLKRYKDKGENLTPKRFAALLKAVFFVRTLSLWIMIMH